jgi:hypothetical protein
MSGNNSGAQKSTKTRLEELRQQILDMEEAAQMEEEALRAQEAEQKCLVDLEKVRQVEIRIQQVEEKRRQEIVKEMVRFRSVCLSFTNVLDRLRRCLLRRMDPACIALEGHGSVNGWMQLLILW